MVIGTLIRIAIVTAIFLTLETFDFWVGLGAHPFWSTKVTYIGIASGIIISLLALLTTRMTGIKPTMILAGFVAMTAIIAAVTLLYGKAEFAASYAENGFAGRIWYIGFMALVAGIFATLVELSRVFIPSVAKN